MAADGVHLAGLPYVVSTTFYAIVVAGLFVFWHRSEGTLSIHRITTRRRELFYWATAFALGTAAGDLTADSMHLGFLTSGIVFAVAMVVPVLGWWKFHVNAVVAFWAGVRPHPSARCIIRRLVRQTAVVRSRPRLWRRDGDRGHSCGDRRPRRLRQHPSQRHPARRRTGRRHPRAGRRDGAGGLTELLTPIPTPSRRPSLCGPGTLTKA